MRTSTFTSLVLAAALGLAPAIAAAQAGGAGGASGGSGGASGGPAGSSGGPASGGSGDTGTSGGTGSPGTGGQSAPSTTSPPSGGDLSDKSRGTTPSPSAAPSTTTGSPSASPTTGDFMGRHTMSGEVTKIDKSTGMFSLRTSEGTLDLHAPPSALAGVEQGDEVSVEIAVKPSK